MNIDNRSSDQSDANIRYPNRRTFLRQSGSCALASLATGTLLAGATRNVTAIEPIKRTGGKQFKFSLAAYSYRNLLSGKNPKLTLDDFVDDCVKLQLDGTELTSYYFPKSPSPEFLRKLKHRCFRQGLDISGTAVGNDFCHPPGEKRAAQIAMVKQWIDYAEILGAPVIRIFSGNVKAGQTKQQAHKLAVDGMQECCEYAGKHGVFLALENHGGLTRTVEGMLALVHDVKSEWFGVNMDTGNFHSHDVYADMARVAPFTVNVQVKVMIRPADGKRQPSDYRRLAKILTEAKYRGYVVLEYEESGDPRLECAKHMARLRKTFGA